MIPGIVASSAENNVPAPPPPEITQRQRAGGGGGTSVSTNTVNYPSTPVSGNMLIAWATTSAAPASSFDAVPGWTVLDTLAPVSGNGVVSWKLYGKVSDGTETGFTQTITGFSTSMQIEVQEWTGLAGLASVYDAISSYKETSEAVDVLTFNPPSVQADQERAVYLCVNRLASIPGTITNWTGLDATYNEQHRVTGHKIVTDGAALDTVVSWTTARRIGAGVLVLRGQ